MALYDELGGFDDEICLRLFDRALAESPIERGPDRLPLRKA